MTSSRMERILEICEILSNEEDLTKTLTQSLKGTGVTSIATLAGALLLGRKGLLAGRYKRFFNYFELFFTVISTYSYFI